MHFVAQGNFVEFPRRTLQMDPEPNLLQYCSFGQLGHLIEDLGGCSTKSDSEFSICKGLDDVANGSFPFGSFSEVS